jgi:glucokinase
LCAPRTGKISVDLVADVGGTNIRCALVERGHLRDGRALACADYPDIRAAVADYLQQTGATPRRAAFALATAIDGDWVKMTNSAWAFSIEDTRRALGFERLLALNDFTALALSLPHLASHELRQVGGGEAAANAPVGLIGAGTGLGVSGLFPSPTGWVAINGEGGHVSFSPANEREADILRIVWRNYPHVSNERLLSGIGFENLYRAIAEVEGKPALELSPTQITQRALDGSDALCVNVVEAFCAMLGSAAANLAVTLGARGGIYIGGGIVPKLGSFFDRSAFRRRFEDKGRFSAYVAAIPTLVILAPHPALIGAAHALAADD